MSTPREKIIVPEQEPREVPEKPPQKLPHNVPEKTPPPLEAEEEDFDSPRMNGDKEIH